MWVITRSKLLKAAAFAALGAVLAGLIFALAAAEAWLIRHYAPELADDPEFWTRMEYYIGAFNPGDEEGVSVFVDLDALTLTVHRDGKAVKTYPCSGGKPSTPSPVGLWSVAYTDSWNEGFGGTWIALNCPWGMYGIHGTLEPWTIGRTNASHGCIRMYSEDVSELRDMLTCGTKVYIKHDSAPFRTLKDGSRGSDVADVQDMLIRAGYLSGNPDGIYGSATFEAVKRFQFDNGIFADGVLGMATFSKLQECTD